MTVFVLLHHKCCHSDVMTSWHHIVFTVMTSWRHVALAVYRKKRSILFTSLISNFYLQKVIINSWWFYHLMPYIVFLSWRKAKLWKCSVFKSLYIFVFNEWHIDSDLILHERIVRYLANSICFVISRPSSVMWQFTLIVSTRGYEKNNHTICLLQK